MTAAEAARAAWAFGPEGGRYEGAAAINRTLAELPGPWPAVAGLYRVPGLRQLEDLGYAAVVRSRHHLGRLTRTRPECAEPGAECG